MLTNHDSRTERIDRVQLGSWQEALRSTSGRDLERMRESEDVGESFMAAREINRRKKAERSGR